jgi:glycosyltransferase involved in cell wall biosynthesis
MDPQPQHRDPAKGARAAFQALPPSGHFLRRTLVIIPALNEAPVISQTVREWIDLGVACVRVVDNGSTDGTSALARAAGADVVREPRRGYGAACWTGLRDLPAGIEWILFSSADGSDRFQPSEFAVWQQSVDDGAELILGNRCLLPGARATLKPAQRLGSLLIGFLMRAGWRVRFEDMGSRRAIRVPAYRRLALRDRAFGWNVEMQVRAVELGLRFAELPVPYFPRRGGVSKISGNWLGSLKASWGIVSTLLKLWITRPFRR